MTIPSRPRPLPARDASCRDQIASLWLPLGGPPVDWLVEPSGCGAGRIGDGSPASAGDSWTRCDRIYGTDPYATVLPSTVRRRGVRPVTTARRAATAGLLL